MTIHARASQAWFDEYAANQNTPFLGFDVTLVEYDRKRLDSVLANWCGPWKDYEMLMEVR